MPRPAMRRPTDGELDILNVLWTRDGQTADEVRRAIGGAAPASPSSIVTRLKIMQAKRLVRANVRVRPRMFYAAVTRPAIRRAIVADIADRLFDGSAKAMLAFLRETDLPTR